VIGRRVDTLADVERPGDYCYVEGYTDDKPAVMFLLPIAHDEGVPAGARSIHHVTAPPHVFRHCDDGSIEIRESIGALGNRAPGHGYIWHGYLDEGHVWREC
jgi:hypothetical protein